MRTRLLGVLVLACSCSSATRKPAHDLVKITVEGTAIEQLPRHVDVFVSDPDASAREFAEQRGAKPDAVHAALVNDPVYGISYSFSRPEDWQIIAGPRFKVGDVCYTYLIEDDAARAAFPDKYGLHRLGDLKAESGSTTAVWRAEPSYHVLIPVPRTVYTCSMHPSVVSPAKGECHLCRMDLIPIKSYE